MQRWKTPVSEKFVFFLWHTSRHQPIAVIGGQELTIFSQVLWKLAV